MIKFSVIFLLAFQKGEFGVFGASAPNWNSPSTGSGKSIDVTDPNVCSEIFILDASSTDTSVTVFSVPSTDPRTTGAFYTGTNINDEDVLQCDISKLSQPSYVVTVRAASTTDSNYYRDINVTITVTGLAPANRAPVLNNLPGDVNVSRDRFETDGPFELFNVSVSDPDGNAVTLTVSDTSIFTTEGSKIKVISSIAGLSSPYQLTITATDDATSALSSSAVLRLNLVYNIGECKADSCKNNSTCINGVNMCTEDDEQSLLAVYVAVPVSLVIVFILILLSLFHIQMAKTKPKQDIMH